MAAADPRATVSRALLEPSDQREKQCCAGPQARNAASEDPSPQGRLIALDAHIERYYQPSRHAGGVRRFEYVGGGSSVSVQHA